MQLGLVDFRDASLPGYELESIEIELSRVSGVGSWQHNGKKLIWLCKEDIMCD
jgi:hypothetical protein